MALLQINIDDTLKKALQKKAKQYGVPISSLVRIVLVKSFTENANGNGNMTHPPVSSPSNFKIGNLFNADRDNNGKGIPLDDFLALF